MEPCDWFLLPGSKKHQIFIFSPDRFYEVFKHGGHESEVHSLVGPPHGAMWLLPTSGVKETSNFYFLCLTFLRGFRARGTRIWGPSSCGPTRRGHVTDPNFRGQKNIKFLFSALNVSKRFSSTGKTYLSSIRFFRGVMWPLPTPGVKENPKLIILRSEFLAVFECVKLEPDCLLVVHLYAGYVTWSHFGAKNH